MIGLNKVQVFKRQETTYQPIAEKWDKFNDKYKA